jgi:D-proline reductase (dithiol) PrdB
MNSIRKIKDRLLAKLFTRYPLLVKRWVKRASFIEFRDSPWTDLKKDISKCRLALVTTGGVHLKEQTPFNMDDPEGDYSFREIPRDVVTDNLMITHNYYDHKDAEKDINIILPVERLKELKQHGEIGDIATRHFSFMGHITGSHIDALVKTTAPKVAELLIADGVDIVTYPFMRNM